MSSVETGLPLHCGFPTWTDGNPPPLLLSNAPYILAPQGGAETWLPTKLDESLKVLCSLSSSNCTHCLTSCCHPVTSDALFSCKQGSRISVSKKYNGRKIEGRGGGGPYWKEGWMELGLGPVKVFFFLRFFSSFFFLPCPQHKTSGLQ